MRGLLGIEVGIGLKGRKLDKEILAAAGRVVERKHGDISKRVAAMRSLLRTVRTAGYLCVHEAKKAGYKTYQITHRFNTPFMPRLSRPPRKRIIVDRPLICVAAPG